MPAVFVGLLLISFVIGLVINYWYVPVLIVAAYSALRLVRYIRKERYFASEPFLAQKRALGAVVAEHNEVARYATDIRNRASFTLGASRTGAQADLASWQNTSRYNYRRDRNVANYQARNVHNCSLQVVRNTSADPVKYLMKYFHIKADEPTLADVENLSGSIARLENAAASLRGRETAITESINPPGFILKHYADEFLDRVGVELPAIEVPYPVYAFEYVSAGGNSSQRTAVELNAAMTDALIEALGQKIRFAKSAAGQRALMTSTLRNTIKARDNYTCQNELCRISLAQEPHLLLEVDHIVPVSRGGMSTRDNLQTLCWRCNRTKSNKLLG